MKSWKNRYIRFCCWCYGDGVSPVFASVYKTVQAQIMADVMFDVDGGNVVASL